MMIELLLNLNACNTTLALLQSTRNSHEHRQQLVHKQKIKQWNTLKDCRVVCHLLLAQCLIDCISFYHAVCFDVLQLNSSEISRC